jgi:hypothetical protein
VRRSLSPERTQNQSQNQNPPIVSIVGGMDTLLSFASEGSVRRGWLESWPTTTGTALLVVCLSLGWCQEVKEWCVPFILVGGVSLCLEVIHRIEKVVGVLGLGMVSLLDVPLLLINTSMGGTIAILVPRGRVCVPPRRDRMDFANTTFEQMARHWFDSFCTNPVLSLLLTLALVFYFVGGRFEGVLVDRLPLLSIHDRRLTMVLQPHPSDDQGVHHFWG